MLDMFDMLEGLGNSLLASKLGTCDQVMCAICKLRCLRRVCFHTSLFSSASWMWVSVALGIPVVKEKEKELSPQNPLGGQ